MCDLTNTEVLVMIEGVLVIFLAVPSKRWDFFGVSVIDSLVVGVFGTDFHNPNRDSLSPELFLQDVEFGRVIPSFMCGTRRCRV
jgi:hypothetical protein